MERRQFLALPAAAAIPTRKGTDWEEREVHDIQDLMVDMPEGHILYCVDLEIVICRTRPNLIAVVAGKHRRVALIGMSDWSVEGVTEREVIQERVRALQASAQTRVTPVLLVDAVDRNRKALYCLVNRTVDFLESSEASLVYV